MDSGLQLGNFVICNMRTRVKICGITTLDDAHLAADAGADAIGLVFQEASPRNVTPAIARTIIDGLPPFLDAYAVVLDPDPRFLDELIERVPLDGIQYHGNEAPDLCARFRGRWIKAVPMNEPGALPGHQRRYPRAQGFLLDSHAPGGAGGTGETFSWTEIQSVDPRPLILAGGLNPGNVATAIRTVRPWGVDVSSGVEASPGQKDPEKIKAFMQEVNHAA